MIRKNSKDLILLEAFKLFSAKTYEQVTYDDFERETGLTRGTILYHFKSKETLFKEVIDKYIFNDHSIIKLLNDVDCQSLKDFIESYLNGINNIKAIALVSGINNINLALMNIEIQAIHYYPNVVEKAVEWQAKEISGWVNILQNAIYTGEIKGNIDISLLSHIFQNIYYGTSYIGILRPKGVDLEILKKEFTYIYDCIKK
jgi:AcrR family transcriptional regulator